MLKKTASGVAAGLLISIGGAVFLACDNKYIGAGLFTVALLCICLKGYSLFTGKVGFIPEQHDKDTVETLLLGLLGNLVGTMLGGYSILLSQPKLSDTAYTLCEKKLELLTASPALGIFQVLLRGVFCGILMYLAVSIYRDKNKIVGILFCIPVFILAGFEHSIADMFYFAASGMIDLRATAFIWIVIAGNALGAMILPGLSMIKSKPQK